MEVDVRWKREKCDGRTLQLLLTLPCHLRANCEQPHITSHHSVYVDIHFIMAAFNVLARAMQTAAEAPAFTKRPHWGPRLAKKATAATAAAFGASKRSPTRVVHGQRARVPGGSPQGTAAAAAAASSVSTSTSTMPKPTPHHSPSRRPPVTAPADGVTIHGQPVAVVTPVELWRSQAAHSAAAGTSSSPPAASTRVPPLQVMALAELAARSNSRQLKAALASIREQGRLSVCVHGLAHSIS